MLDLRTSSHVKEQMTSTKKESSDPDTRCVYLSSTDSAVSRTPTSGEAANKSAAREVVVASKSQRPKKQNIVVERDDDDEEDEYR